MEDPSKNKSQEKWVEADYQTQIQIASIVNYLRLKLKDCMVTYNVRVD